MAWYKVRTIDMEDDYCTRECLVRAGSPELAASKAERRRLDSGSKQWYGYHLVSDSLGESDDQSDVIELPKYDVYEFTRTRFYASDIRHKFRLKSRDEEENKKDG